MLFLLTQGEPHCRLQAVLTRPQWFRKCPCLCALPGFSDRGPDASRLVLALLCFKKIFVHVFLICPQQRAGYPVVARGGLKRTCRVPLLFGWAGLLGTCFVLGATGNKTSNDSSALAAGRGPTCDTAAAAQNEEVTHAGPGRASGNWQRDRRASGGRWHRPGPHM